MAVSQRLELRQTQTLVMTPQLQQAIKLLQLSNLELATYLEHELERNPLLERDDGNEDDARPGAEPERAGPAAGEPPASVRDTAELTGGETLPAEADAPLDIDYGNVYDDSPVDDWSSERAAFAHAGGGGAWTGEEDQQSLEQRVSAPVTLRQHLLDQLGVDIRDPADRMIGLHLIEMLDESGYLVGDLDRLAELLGCEPARIEATLRAVQRFDPPGIFARSLGECLALQLADRNRLDPAMQAMLDNLPLLAKRDFAALRKVCGVDDEDLAEMIAEIRSLDPKPAQVFDAVVAAPVVPDILMRADPSGAWIVELNSDTLPRVLVNTRYHALVAARARTKTDKEYISQQFQSASWLVRSLHQRATTILKVATEIIRQQDPFFRKGVRHLKPLTLRDIAEAIMMHESTVSRVTSNKYIATPRGVFELKYFFTSAIGGANGEAHSAEAVRHRIKALIDAETSGRVLSDDAIVERLRADGIDIARRTVAKYREAMRIPSSVQRRRDKAPEA
ncbi:MAG: RNA polymerase factor sigma-54 [Kiloniellaceae bacterium]